MVGSLKKLYDLYGTIYDQSVINLVGRPGEQKKQTAEMSKIYKFP